MQSTTRPEFLSFMCDGVQLVSRIVTCSRNLASGTELEKFLRDQGLRRATAQERDAFLSQYPEHRLTQLVVGPETLDHNRVWAAGRSLHGVVVS